MTATRVFARSRVNSPPCGATASVLGAAFGVLLCGAMCNAQPETAWRQKHPAVSPSARSKAAMAYDASRERVVLFGGKNANTIMSDTWEWDGVNWSRVSTSGPSARNGAVMVYDEAGRRVLLFGGGNLQTCGELWSWDGNAWTMLSSGGIPGRLDAGFVYDSRRGRAVVFSGTVLGNDASITWPADTWEWDGTGWASIPTDFAPEGRMRLRMVFDSARQRSVMMGGFHPPDALFGDEWEWDGENWARSQSAGSPGVREFHAAASDSTNGRIVVFGGQVGAFNYLGSTALHEVGTWVELKGDGPTPSASAGLAYDIRHRRFLLFGGRAATGDLGETWELVLPPNCSADYDGDGFVSGVDFDLFVHDFQNGREWADTNLNGFVEGEDFDMFVGAFEAGCV